MFQGLMLTSLTVLVARSALFQRKSRSGFLDELDEIRSDALETGDAEGDLWTDLREGGEYSDPHEIEGLYADDSTPDQPGAKWSGPRSTARRADRKPPRREPTPAPPPPTPEPTPVADEAPAPPPPPPPPPPPAAEPTPAPEPVAAAPIEAAPHPVRPSEMWHSADGAPAALGEPLAPIETAPIEAASFDTAVLASSPPTAEAPAPAPVSPPPVDPFEADAPQPPAGAEPIVDFTGGLVPGPVGRRHRRDRPEARKRATLPPPAEARTTEPAPEPDPVPVAVAEPEPVPEPVTEPVAAEQPVAAAPAAELIVPDADGMVGVSGALVRVATDLDGEVRRSGTEATVTLRQGWCWVAPGEGEPIAVAVELPNSRLVADAGSTVLCVVEPDGSSFVIVAAGSTTLGRGDDVAPLPRGSIVMIDPSGGAQIDQAEPPEIEADPLVSANLALDAEL